MKKVLQSKVSPVDGDCMRAVVASLLDLELNDVPNFIEYKEACNRELMQYFLDKGYDPCFIYSHNYTVDQLKEIARICGGINGYFYASVPSQTYKDGSHAVVVDLDLNVVHDPNPNQKCLGLKAKDVQDILTVGKFLIPEHIKMKHEIRFEKAEKFIEELKAKGTGTMYCRNESGILWESLWKYENGIFMQKTIASGLFNDWTSYESENTVKIHMVKDYETIDKVKDN